MERERNKMGKLFRVRSYVNVHPVSLIFLAMFLSRDVLQYQVVTLVLTRGRGDQDAPTTKKGILSRLKRIANFHPFLVGLSQKNR